VLRTAKRVCIFGLDYDFLVRAKIAALGERLSCCLLIFDANTEQSNVMRI